MDRETLKKWQSRLSPMNFKRATWAGKAIDTFIEAVHTDGEDALADLLGDLMHYAEGEGLDFEVELVRARAFYTDETDSECHRCGLRYGSDENYARDTVCPRCIKKGPKRR